ncbi:putative ABC transporter substrate-binding protein [Afipia carboxidovorans OM5]|uniref:Putative ABC transporter substrate-binding protein n=2 Tax=Afipia carboxidovorans TaxID=40137 RepID=F8BZF1_AFIC5|nr:ABC transporter substrate-binding protein [Afipia carboxidovorans]AEI03477.1 putative ABC transporter substrate-binding protein [Afipia carboxidovorans OM4]AEI07054.1 putative ABC transporter substrate-binding protein [Afipia carboxidovorans OM5]
MDTRSATSDRQRTKGLWDMIMDDQVSETDFRKLHRNYLAHRDELERISKRRISRREFAQISASIAASFGIASTIGNLGLGVSKTYAAEKGAKKGTIRIGYINTLDCCLFDYILEKKGIFQSMGWDAKFLGAAGGPQVMEAFIGNEIDFAYVGSNTPGLAAQKGINSRLIVGGMFGMGGLAVSDKLYNEGVTDIPSFFEKAKKRAAEGNPIGMSTQVPGTLTHACAMIAAKDNGLDADRDLDLKYLPPPEVSSSMMSGVVESQLICEQFGSYPEYFKKGKVIAHCLDSGKNMMPCDGLPEQTYTQCTALAARPGLPDEMVQACIEGHRRAAQFMKDNPAETIKIAAAVSGTKGPLEYVAMFNRARWHYGINWESCDSVWNNTMRKIGLAKKNLKLDELIDTKNSMELKAGFESTAGVTQKGPVDVTSQDFRNRVWAEAMSKFG